MKVISSFQKEYKIVDRRYNKTYPVDTIPERVSMDYTASGLSRLWRWRAIADIGMISANRALSDDFYNLKDKSVDIEPYKLTRAENKARTKSLETDLRAEKSVGYVKIQGLYEEIKENNETIKTSEDSFFVYSLNPDFDLRDFLVKLGVKYSQDSILFSKANSDTYDLVLTNKFTGQIGITDFTLNGSRWGTLDFITRNEQNEIVKELATIYSNKKYRDKAEKNGTSKTFWFGVKDVENPDDVAEYLKQKASCRYEVKKVCDYTAEELKNKIANNVYHKKLSMWGQESYLTTRFALSSILKDNY